MRRTYDVVADADDGSLGRVMLLSVRRLVDHKKKAVLVGVRSQTVDGFRDEADVRDWSVGFNVRRIQGGLLESRTDDCNLMRM